jgi:hypothetical protein
MSDVPGKILLQFFASTTSLFDSVARHFLVDFLSLIFVITGHGGKGLHVSQSAQTATRKDQK